MTNPRDRDVLNRVGGVRFARTYSNIVSPPMMFATMGLAVALWELPFWQGLAWAAIYGLLVSLAPILFVLYLLKTGRITELHMSNTRERHLPYLSAFFFSAVTFGLVTLFQGPALMRCLTMFNMVELALLGIINLFTLISIHATGAMASIIVVGLIFGWAAGLAVLPFAVGVVWARLYLKRHTPIQIMAGLVLGVVSVLSLTLLGCFR